MDNMTFVDRVMRLLALVEEQKVHKERGVKKGRHSTSSSSAFHHRSASYQFNDDEEIQDEGVCDFLATHTAPFRKFLEPFLCFVGISRYYEVAMGVYLVFLDVMMEAEREDQIKEGQNLGCLVEPWDVWVFPAGVNDQGNKMDDVQDVGQHQNEMYQDDGQDVNEEAVDYLPLLLLMLSLTPEHEGGGRTDSVNGPYMRTQYPTERFVVLSDSPCHSSSNAADAEVSSVVRSLCSCDPPYEMTTSHCYYSRFISSSSAIF
ncbi:hypothetical protein Tco_1406397 [Tanacetum coccineum]